MLRVSRDESDCALAVLDQFYRLQQKKLAGMLDDLEKRTLALARNYFEPIRMTPQGPRREAVRIDALRCGSLRSADGEQVIEVLQIHLRQVEVRLTRLLAVGTPVVLELRPATADRPFRFAGRIEARRPGSDRAIIRLGNAVRALAGSAGEVRTSACFDERHGWTASRLPRWRDTGR